jgi:hypothetical protein
LAFESSCMIVRATNPTANFISAVLAALDLREDTDSTQTEPKIISQFSQHSQ